MRTASIAALSVLIVASLFATQTLATKPTGQKTPPPQITVAQILDKYVQALGGRAAYGKLRNRVAKGTVEMPNLKGSGTVEFYASAPNKVLNVMQLPALGTMKQGFNGVTAWNLNSLSGVRQVKGGELAAIKRESNFYRDINLGAEYSRMILKGRDKVGEREAYVVEGLLSDGARDKFYFDIQSGLLMRYSSERETEYGRQPGDLYLWEYREVDGVKVPFWLFQVSELPTGDGIVLTIRWTEVRHNVDMDGSIFDAPRN